MLFDLAQQVSAMAGAFAGNPLNVFGVNTESVHTFLVLLLVFNFVRIIYILRLFSAYFPLWIDPIFSSLPPLFAAF